VRLSIVLTLPPRYRCPLDRLPASRLSCPRAAGWSAATSCYGPSRRFAATRQHVRSREKTGLGAGISLGVALGVSSITRALRTNLSPQCGDQSPSLTCPPNIVRTEHNAFVRSKRRLVLKSVLEARRGCWVWPKVAHVETHRGTAGQKASG
jgi:hypothetical protein